LAAALLAVEFLDELVFGAWTAAWPRIRGDLGLSYVQVGILLSLPAIFGSALEPLLGLLADAWNRRAIVRAGGVAFFVGLGLIASSSGFLALLLALMVINPASGAFVALSQAVLMDTDPVRREQNMARWVLAGSLGVVAGPLVLVAAGWLGLGWRAAFASFMVPTALLVLVVWRMPLGVAALPERPLLASLGESMRETLRALDRRAVLRWLTLLQCADLMLDVLHGFLALYFVDVVGVTDAKAALAIVVWTVVGLAGDALALPLLERVEGTRYLRASAWAVAVVFPAFLLVDQVALKLLLVGALAVLNSGWYSVLSARLYSELPGRSGSVMAMSSVFGMAGGLLPLAIGSFAERFGLSSAMWLMMAGPLSLLLGLPRGTRSSAAPSPGTGGPSTPPGFRGASS
jgi:FSR family fosmidomycin resistance protein-like MFS transporter